MKAKTLYWIIVFVLFTNYIMVIFVFPYLEGRETPVAAGIVGCFATIAFLVWLYMDKFCGRKNK